MTTLYKDFQINVTADNVKREANNKLICETGQKILLKFVGIAPLATENSYIQVYQDQTLLTGEGIYHAIIDDYVHRVDFEVKATEGQEFVAKAWGPNACTIYGVYAYEIL